MRAAAVSVLLLAAGALGACRARLPVEREPTIAQPAVQRPQARQPVAAAHEGLAPFLHGDANLETPSTDPTRPFLAEVQTDRLRALVRRAWHPERGGSLFGFVFAADTCTPSPRR